MPKIEDKEAQISKKIRFLDKAKNCISLYEAVCSNNPSILETYVESGIFTYREQLVTQETPLHKAASLQDSSMLLILLQNKLRIGPESYILIRESKEHINSSDNSGNTALINAVKRSALDCCIELLKSNYIDVFIKNKGGKSALLLAVLNLKNLYNFKNIEILKNLLENISSSNQVNSVADIAESFIYACKINCSQAVNIFFDHIKLDSLLYIPNGYFSPLYYACNKNNYDLVVKLLSKMTSFDIESPNSHIEDRTVLGYMLNSLPSKAVPKSIEKVIKKLVGSKIVKEYYSKPENRKYKKAFNDSGYYYEGSNSKITIWNYKSANKRKKDKEINQTNNEKIAENGSTKTIDLTNFESSLSESEPVNNRVVSYQEATVANKTSQTSNKTIDLTNFESSSSEYIPIDNRVVSCQEATVYESSSSEHMPIDNRVFSYQEATLSNKNSRTSFFSKNSSSGKREKRKHENSNFNENNHDPKKTRPS